MSLHQLNRIIWIVLLATHAVVAQKSYLLRPDRIFDGQEIRENWHVLVVNDKIVAVGDAKTIATVTQSSKAEIIDLKGCTLLPGFIEGRSHLLLHPYNETT